MSETSKKRVRANTEPDPETVPHVPDEQKGQPSSRLEASKGAVRRRREAPGCGEAERETTGFLVSRPTDRRRRSGRRPDPTGRAPRS